jgi:hypothetical protein
VTSLEWGDHLISLAVASGSIFWELAIKPIIRRVKAKMGRSVEVHSGYTSIQ